MKTLKNFIILLFIGLGYSLQAQVHIAGTISDGKNPLAGASVFIENSYDGATSDLNGAFSFSTSESGKQTLVVEFLGFEPFRVVLDLSTDQEGLEVIMNEAFNELKAATIAAGSFAAGEGKRATILKPLDIATTAGSNGNVVGALQTLPGTTPVGENGRLFVRGGAAGETQVFVDGMLVHEAYTSSAPQTQVRGRFNPFLFSGTTFSTGGYSAEFGQALSAVLLLETDDPPVEDAVNLAVMTVGGDLTGNKSWGNGGLMASASYINLGPYMDVIPQNFQWRQAPQAVDGTIRLGQDLPNGGSMRMFVQGSSQGFELGRKTPGDEGNLEWITLRNRFGFGSVSYTQPLSDKVMLDAGASLTTNGDRFRLEEGDFREDLLGSFAKARITLIPKPTVKIRLGGVLIHSEYEEAFETSQDAGVAGSSYREALPAAFAEGDFHLGNRLVLRAGLRGEYSDYLNAWNAAPRMSFAWKLNDEQQVSVAAGRFYQNPVREELVHEANLSFTRADQLLVNWQRVESGRVIRVEGFVKRYQNLVTYGRDSWGQPANMLNTGHGEALGAEIFMRDSKSIKFLDAWVSYSFLETTRLHREFPEETTPGFASQHVFSMVAKYWISAWRSQVGLTFQYASARPFDNPVTPAFNDDRTSPFRTLDMNWSYLFRQQIIFHASITNLPGFRNTFGMRYGANADGSMASSPVLPAAWRFVFVGCFITLSTDKETNQLDKI